MEKPNYRIEKVNTAGITGAVISGVNLRRSSKTIEEKTFCLLDCMCQSVCRDHEDCEHKRSCSCNTQEKKTCDHCYCDNHCYSDDPCRCDTESPFCSFNCQCEYECGCDSVAECGDVGSS